MPNLMSRCPFCDEAKDKITAIIVTGRAVMRAYRCGTFVYKTEEGVDVYEKSCYNG
jgi:hypothetical protein